MFIGNLILLKLASSSTRKGGHSSNTAPGCGALLVLVIAAVCLFATILWLDADRSELVETEQMELQIVKVTDPPSLRVYLQDTKTGDFSTSRNFGKERWHRWEKLFFVGRKITVTCETRKSGDKVFQRVCGLRAALLQSPDND